MTELENEKNKLVEVLKILENTIYNETKRLDELRKLYLKDPIFYGPLFEHFKFQKNNLSKSKNNPYFARMDFTDEQTGKSVIYIGKRGLSDESENIVITDWRAPISSLYYDSELGEASYESPSGVIKGDLELKRQFDIIEGKLYSFYDVDIVSNDYLLQKYLAENNSSRLKNIVSTIQKEQNNIIRRPLEQNVLVQGVAGSGKTTIALHRIAYLLYTYKDKIKPNNILVIGSNDVFMKYVKSVLPDLDADTIQQYSYVDFCKEYIGDNINISNTKLLNVNTSECKKQQKINRIKCSLDYKKMIDKFINAYYGNLFAKDLEYKGYKILSKEKIREIFDSIEDKNNLQNIIERLIIMVTYEINNQKPYIKSAVMSKIAEDFKNAKDESERKQLRKINSSFTEAINGDCKSLVRNHFSKFKSNPLNLYKQFIKDCEKYNDTNLDEIKYLKQHTIKNLKENIVDFEDLAALTYIKYLTNNQKEYNTIKHTAIDEAQDLGEFNLYSLAKILNSSTFSLFGDLNQSIYEYRGLDSWNQLYNIFDDLQYIEFNKSYRTTSEIMQTANKIAKHLKLSEAEEIIRHGSNVNYTELTKDDNYYLLLKSIIEQYKNSGYKTIAIIVKTDEDAKSITDGLSKIGLEIPIISQDDDITDNNFNICVISSDLVKGLEFDATIIVDAQEKKYSSKNKIDMKLLYVAITRALHEANIIYKGELVSPLLERKKQNNKI